jgi:tryptophan-rich sensory protein
MPRYFSATWLVYIISCVTWAVIEFGYDAVLFLLPIVLSGFFVSLLVTLIVDRVARRIGIEHDPFASRFDWKDDD